MIALRGSRDDGALDDRCEPAWQRIQHLFHDAGVARSSGRVRRCRDGDIGHVNVGKDVIKGGPSSRVVNEELVR